MSEIVRSGLYNEEYSVIPTNKIVIDTNVRSNYNEENLEELSESIKQHGQLQPIRVYRREEHFVIIFGHRRFLACKMAGIETMKCIIGSQLETAENILIQLIENEQKENLSPEDFENNIFLLKNKHNLSANEIAQKLNKDKAYIYRIIKAAEKREKYKEMFYKFGIKLTTRDLISMNNFDEDLMIVTIKEIAKNPKNKISIINDAAKKAAKNIEIYEINIIISINNITKIVYIDCCFETADNDPVLLPLIKDHLKRLYIEKGFSIQEEPSTVE